MSPPSSPIKSLDEHSIDDVIAVFRKHHPSADGALIRLAYEYAGEAHGDQRRKSGEPYITHPLSVADSLAHMGLDETTIAAALLHDVPEDTDYSLRDIKKEFGKEIAFLVEGITKLGQLKYRGVDRYVENLRRMVVAMAQDVRVILIKFADRIHNLKTLDALPPEKRYRIALESLEIYAPIANRLGMGEMRGQIEDLSFPHVHPEAYQWMQRDILPLYNAKLPFLEKFEHYMIELLNKNQITYKSVHGRSKHLYSLYEKLKRHDYDISQIYDLVALRIIVNDISTCYATLGIIHAACKPLKGRIKDYIAQPKPNGYQSLHTTVFAPSEFARDEDYTEIIEIQIRTPQMHAEAEYGVAAHWKYKAMTQYQRIEDYRPQLNWMQQLVEVQKQVKDEEQFLETLKIDVFSNYIFIFTPRGDVIELPEEATPVDFAYKIHSDLGKHCGGAKVNDQFVSLDTKLKSGDVVEIIPNPHRKGPSADWLEFVKTNHARHHIRSYVNKKSRRLFDKIPGLKKSG